VSCKVKRFSPATKDARLLLPSEKVSINNAVVPLSQKVLQEKGLHLDLMLNL